MLMGKILLETQRWNRNLQKARQDGIKVPGSMERVTIMKEEEKGLRGSVHRSDEQAELFLLMTLNNPPGDSKWRKSEW